MSTKTLTVILKLWGLYLVVQYLPSLLQLAANLKMANQSALTVLAGIFSFLLPLGFGFWILLKPQKIAAWLDRN